ncbi:hypothetical protein [Engelhardtia mirabilis]|uniref:Uncharacterized protein n=1 Tax=Engelhardtia mirabilis TaxID=2528011 RepID=A0A518BR91_9BACT|nr:hypothetical protein Pla133_46080 [Planctomycetes bacterium Pla133]QDV03814.1 hypothetical protein Pla86_46060 [Planctomycetes bacterium Pla86]
MKLRTTAVALSTLVLAAATWIYLLGVPRGDAAGQAPAVARAAAVPTPVAGQAELTSPVAPTTQALAPREPQASEPGARRPAGDAGFAGLVLVMEEGGVVRDGDGTLSLVAVSETRVQHDSLAFRGGLFTIPGVVGALQSLRVDGAWMDGVRVPVVGEGRAEEVAGPFATVRVDHRGAESIEVCSRATGEHLDGVEIIVLERGNALPSGVPRPERFSPGRWLARGARSPLTLGRLPRLFPGQTTFAAWVRARDHAWRCVWLGSSGQQRVELEPGGDLRVRVVGESTQRVSLSLADAAGGSSIASEALSSGGELRLDGLAVGDYSLRISAGQSPRTKDAMLARELSVRAGQVTRFDLDLGEFDSLLAEHPVAVELTARGWPERRRVSASVYRNLGGERFIRVDQVRLETSDLSEDNHFTGSLGSLRAGAYALQLHELARIESFQVSGPTTVALELPPPESVLIECVDEQTGRQLDAPTIAVSSSRGSALVPHRSRSFARVGPGLYQVQVAPGALNITIGSPQISRRTATVDCPPGAERLVARFLPPTELQIVFAVDGRRIARSMPGTDVSAAAVDGEGRSDFCRSRSGVYHIGLSEPGRYRIGIVPAPAYLPVNDQIVELAAGINRIEVPLERRP